jgi:hypothetical protein
VADGYLNFDTKINEKGFNEGVGKLSKLGKSGLSIVSKAMTGAVVAVGTAAGAIIKLSLGVVANMEQQIGGVETLFKDSANTVIDNANRAYKTAGMSANNYMETVTSFSASLLQSLGGDTAKAASYADRAIVDMSDNANKMGTSMRDIQNAYQGFAKQNYTMLDNLKLGYGGTQEEMKRLVSDAAKLTDVQKELGVTVDANSLSFGKTDKQKYKVGTVTLGYYDASYLYATIDLDTDQWNGGVVFTSMFSIRNTPYEQVISFSTTEVQGNKVTIWARGSGFVNGHSLLVGYLIIPKN